MKIKFYDSCDHDNPIYIQAAGILNYRKGDFVSFDQSYAPNYEIISVSHLILLDLVIIIVRKTK
jgi:hypothetical protein